jgi:thiol-disulfide isomerase/thioredoxin
VAIAAGVWLSLRHESAPAPDPEVFYRQNLLDADGVTRPMGAYRGRVVVVNFWATWCAPCVKEIPAFSKVHADGGGRVDFVGLGIDSPDNVAAFAGRFKPSYPLVVAGAVGTDLARALGDEGGELPFTVVFGPDGRVVASHLGQVDEATLRSWLAPFIAPAAS